MDVMIPWRVVTLKIVIDALAFEKVEELYVSTRGGHHKDIIELLWIFSAHFFGEKQAYFSMPAFAGESGLF